MGRARQAGDAGLEIRLLGALDVLAGGAPVTIGGPKLRALLAVLALEAGRVVSVDRLVECLWPGEPPETAAHAVQVYVSQLRKRIGQASIERRPGGYELALGRDAVDVHRFARLAGEGRAARHDGDTVSAERRLREALSLWRGAALSDFTYEPFAQSEIARLEELRLLVLEERLEVDLLLGRHGELVAELEALVGAQPLRERPRAQLMLALYRAGRQADALAAYRAARASLVEELGIEPGPELRELEAAILRQDPSLLLYERAPQAATMQFRRLVTILFVDLVDPIALAEGLDPEALGRVLRRYLESVSEALSRHGGEVEEHAGEAVMATFGIPLAHEDDALRAARAALDLRAGIAALNQELVLEHGNALDIRVAFETGEVVATETAAGRRLVTGGAVAIASRIGAAAGAGEIVVGELAARLIDHAATLEPLGEVELTGKREPVRAFRLLRLTPAPPAFAGRLDAPLVDRTDELAVIRAQLERTRAQRSAHAVLVVGPPGVGKSRLAAEVAGRVKDSTQLWGRCLSYGDGITYWPLRDVLTEAPAGAERDAVLAALETATPPPAAEISMLFRRFCEASARERGLTLVFDDVHWAEPTFLDLVEALVDRGEGEILVLCLAREELDETRPGFLAGSGRAERVELDVLSAKETLTLLDGLGGEILESDQRARIVEAADGNPFFLEQLLALAYEGGLAAHALPETVRALLAARLDRLGPGERAVLERAAVIGKRFHLDDVLALLDAHAVPTLDAHVRTLVAGGFVRPFEAGEYRFRHVLVQEAVYRSAPKRLRAELHERFVERFGERASEVGDLDEFAGYHLEQAHRLRTELGEWDERTTSLASAAAERLSAAGLRAFRRGDSPAAGTLLERAVAVLPRAGKASREHRCNLAIVLAGRGETERAVELLEQSLADSRAVGDDHISAWARIELAYLEVRRGRATDDLLAAATEGIPIFERVEDHRALGRAWLFAGWVHGGHHSDHTAWAAAVENALAHYRLTPWSTSTCLGELAGALYWGPTPVADALARYDELLRDERTDRIGAAYLDAFRGGQVAQRGEFDAARELVESARKTLEEFGHEVAARNYCGTIRGEIELLARDSTAAATVLRALCDELLAANEHGMLASRASDLAKALVLQDQLDEAEEWTLVAERHAAEDDLNAQMMWRPVRAKILASRGELAAAEALAREATLLGERTDDSNRRADAYRDLGAVLRLAGHYEEASEAFEQARVLFAEKGNVVGEAHVRSLEDEAALVET